MRATEVMIRMKEPTHETQEVLEGDVLGILLDGEEKCTSLQLFFLRRLGSLLQLRQKQVDRLNGEGLLLLDRAIFSVYRDCGELGAGQEAQRIIQYLTVAAQKRAEN